jgi:hypothetical protein
MKATYKGAGVDPINGTIMGINLSRTDHPSEEYTCFAPTMGPFLNLHQWGHLVLSDDDTTRERALAAIAATHARVMEERIQEELDKLCFGQPKVLGQTWVAQGDTIYGARPDARGPIGGGPGYQAIVTQGDYLVTTPKELVAALAAAKAGEVIFIHGNAVLDFTVQVNNEALKLVIPAGVTLASDRGHEGSRGALIMSDTLATNPLFECGGPNVRLTGLRLRGPDRERRMDLHVLSADPSTGKPMIRGLDREYYYRFPTSAGIRTKFDHLEVDNCELAGWSHAAIYLVSGREHLIHHNYIHHNQRNALGYGMTFDAASGLVEANLFNANRHSIAGSGSPGCSYEARNNVEYGVSMYHCFDMHGGRDRLDGTEIAGTVIKIHHNTFRSHEKPIRIRGVPEIGATIDHNWFLWHRPNQPVAFDTPVETSGKTEIFDNAYGTPTPEFLDARGAK